MPQVSIVDEKFQSEFCILRSWVVFLVERCKVGSTSRSSVLLFSLELDYANDMMSGTRIVSAITRIFITETTKNVRT